MMTVCVCVQAERFGESFVFEGLLSEEVKSSLTHAVQKNTQYIFNSMTLLCPSLRELKLQSVTFNLILIIEQLLLNFIIYTATVLQLTDSSEH